MDSPLYVVGVGASAGGLEALEQLFGQMPPDTGLAFVVVQHLSPDFKSVMDELLARRTKIPVTLVEDGVRVEANHIYLIPPKKEMIIAGGRLLLSDKGTSPELTLPIDIFLRSLARDVGSRAIGVVLSGGGSDGSRGIRDIHEAGGLVLCQDEGSAAFDGMPRSARDTGVVDHVTNPEAMPGLLLEYVKKMESGDYALSLDSAPPRGMNAVFRLLQQEFGIDFSYYKPNTVVRRIERRVQMSAVHDFDAYVQKLASERQELDALYRDLLIGVTRFFRDEEAFELVERTIVPHVLERGGMEEIRIWVPGCATGEEAYSIAILFHEAMTRHGDRRRLKVFATDVHHGSLDLATRGIFGAESISRVSKARLERYFEVHGDAAVVSAELRQIIVFARHNVVKDAPFTRVDFVSCRNLLIYLQPIAQRKVLGLFHFALKNQGILLLGPSESPGGLSDDFESVNSHWRIYRKHRDHRVTADTRVPVLRSADQRVAHASLGGGHYSLAQTVSIYDALLDEHMPPSLLVNERRELVHAFGGAGRFVKMKDGRPSLDILDMVEADLKLALTGALQRALKERSTIVYKALRLNMDGESGVYRLVVKPVFAKSTVAPHLLVTLEREGAQPPASERETEIDAEQVSQEQLSNLETELRYTKENLQATIEEVETSNEELQATNEELLAANEELQSTNEELQSVNEELYTVNAEYQKKIAQLTELTNDMDNLLLSTDVGTIFLDKDLCIRKFTPKISNAFNLLPQDLGRPLAGFSNNLNYPQLMTDVDSVLATEKPVECEVRDRSGSWFFLRILPYRASGMSQGVVLTLVDITTLKEAENALFRERYLLDSLLDSVPDAIYFKDAKNRFVRLNHAMAMRLGARDAAAVVGKHTLDFVPEDVAARLDAADQNALRGERQPYRLEQDLTATGTARWFMTTRQPLFAREGNVIGMCAIARDVTEQKGAEDEIRQAVAQRDQFLAMLSHELRNPLGAIVTASRLLSQHSSGGTMPREVAIIERQSHQMARLLDDLLEANRITHNKIDLEKKVVDIKTIVDDALAALSSVMDPHRLDLTVDVHDGPIPVSGDPARLQQVVVNLLGNAAKYTEVGGKVWLKVHREAGSAVIAVKDNGVGIEPGLLGSIFDLFVQGSRSLARTEGGMGVGLTLVRALVEMHGGTVTACSDGIGRGSEFTVRLPLAERESIAAAPEAAPKSTAPQTERRPIRVAIVDDNIDSCAMLEEFLRSLGYDVHCAHDGESGLDVIVKRRPHVAVVDIGLPKLTGYEVASRIRATGDHRSVYLVALTGYGRASDRAAALDAGFDEHLVKPLQPEDLHRILRERAEAVPIA